MAETCNFRSGVLQWYLGLGPLEFAAVTRLVTGLVQEGVCVKCALNFAYDRFQEADILAHAVIEKINRHINN